MLFCQMCKSKVAMLVSLGEILICEQWASQVALVVKNSPANAGDARDASSILGLEDPLEEGIAIHSSILAWEIPWTEEPGRLQSIGSQRSDMTQVT